MEELNYRELIKKLIEKHQKGWGENESIETRMIFDEKRDSYLLMNIGWEDEHRVLECPIHIHLKKGKIYVERDFTEDGIAQDLVLLGVPKEDIVLAFRSPFVRQFSEFSVA